MWDAFALVPGSLLGAVQCVRAAFSPHINSRTRRSWLLLAAGLVAWAAADARWYLLREVVTGVPVTTHALYFSYYALTAGGLLSFPSAARVPRIQFGLDVATVVLGGSMMVSYLVIGPMTAVAGRDPAETAVLVPYAVCDLVLLLASAALVMKPLHPATRPAFWLLALGQVLSFSNGLVYAAEAIIGEYGERSLFPKVYLLVQLLFAASAYAYRRLASSSDAVAPVPDSQARVSLLPYAAIAMGLATLVYAAGREGAAALSALTLGAVALTAVVVARQVMAVQEGARLRVEREARSSEERVRVAALREWRDTFDAIQSPLLVLDADDRLTQLNEGAARLAGRAAPACVGLRLAELARAEPWREARLLAEAARRGGGSGSSRVRDPGGERTWDLSARLFRSGEPGEERVILTFEDVTQRLAAEESARRLEDQLRESQKLETLGTLAGGIAHDFNNVLQAIQGCAEQARRSDSAEAARGYLDRLTQATTRASQLVRQILTFARRGDPERRPVLLGSIVQETVKLMRATLPRTIEIRCAASSDATILADPTQIHQVIMNLCTNAQHAMEVRGGVLELELERVEAGLGPPWTNPRLEGGRWVRLRVRDTGRGMGENIQERIFEPFFTTKGAGRGTGLGLSVAHGIVTSHGGFIQVQSEPERGTVFDVYLREAEGASIPPPLLAGAVALEGRRVLYVDDEEIVAATVTELLETQGAQVVTKTDSLAALEAVRAQPQGFDLAIVDQTMPRMSGIELARELRVLRADLPIVVTSGYGAAISSTRLRSLGASSYLPKPFGIPDLLRAVAEALEARRAGGA